jgi:hypothetical protein
MSETKKPEALTMEQLQEVVAQHLATIKAQEETITQLTTAVAELNAQLTEKEEIITTGKVTCTVDKKKYEIVAKKIRVTKHVSATGIVDWPAKIGKSELTAVELAKEKAYLAHLVAEESGILKEVEIKEK